MNRTRVFTNRSKNRRLPHDEDEQHDRSTSLNSCPENFAPVSQNAAVNARMNQNNWAPNRTKPDSRKQRYHGRVDSFPMHAAPTAAAAPPKIVELGAVVSWADYAEASETVHNKVTITDNGSARDTIETNERSLSRDSCPEYGRNATGRGSNCSRDSKTGSYSRNKSNVPGSSRESNCDDYDVAANCPSLARTRLETDDPFLTRKHRNNKNIDNSSSQRQPNKSGTAQNLVGEITTDIKECHLYNGNVNSRNEQQNNAIASGSAPKKYSERRNKQSSVYTADNADNKNRGFDFTMKTVLNNSTMETPFDGALTSLQVTLSDGLRTVAPTTGESVTEGGIFANMIVKTKRSRKRTKPKTRREAIPIDSDATDPGMHQVKLSDINAIATRVETEKNSDIIQPLSKDTDNLAGPSTDLSTHSTNTTSNEKGNTAKGEPSKRKAIQYNEDRAYRLFRIKWDPRIDENSQRIMAMQILGFFPRSFEVSRDFVYPQDRMRQFNDSSTINLCWYCLLCRTTNPTMRRVNSHIESIVHVQNVADTKCMEALQHYHTFWNKETPTCFRRFQINFQPVPQHVGKMACDRCGRFMPYRECIRHLMDECPLYGQTSDKQTNKNEKKSDLPDAKDDVKKSEVTENDNKTKHNIEKFSINSDCWKSILQTPMSSRFDNDVQHFELVQEFNVRCIPCDKEIRRDAGAILDHITSVEHFASCNLPDHPGLVKYSCEVCDLRYKLASHFWNHANSESHANKASTYAEGAIVEFTCTKCKYVGIGDVVGILDHEKFGGGRKNKPQAFATVVIPIDVRASFQSANAIKSKVSALAYAANQLNGQYGAIDLVIQDLDKLLRTVYPNVKSYPFGSRITGLCYKKSDLDIYVDVDSNYTGYKFDQPVSSILRNVERVMFRRTREWDDFFAVKKARTPIIQVRHVRTSIDLDISFHDGLSIENTKFLLYCLSTQPILRDILLLLKWWCVSYGFKERLSTYALCMMVIFVMQMDGYLIPSLYLRLLNMDSPAKSRTINGWEIVDYKLSYDEMRAYAIPYEGTITTFFQRFFAYYASFDYSSKMICILTGEAYDMTSWSDVDVSNLPEQMFSYKHKVTTGQLSHLYFMGRYSMCIQDPFDLSHNLTKGVSDPFVESWQGNCKLMAELLSPPE